MFTFLSAGFGATVQDIVNKDPKTIIVPDSVQKVQLRTFLEKALSPEYYKEMWPEWADAAFWFGVKIIMAIIIFFVGRWILRRLSMWSDNTFRQRRVDPSIRSFSRNLFNVIGYCILAIAIISVFGIKLAGLSTIIAALGLGIGMALKDTIQNFAGGMIILALKPYRIGDFIKVGDNTGTVKHIKLFTTHITTIDNKAIYIPNGTIAASDVENVSAEPIRRVDWKISLSYGDDVDTAKRIILEIINADPRVLPEPAVPFVALSEMATNSINIVARAWTKNETYWDLYFDINERLYKELPLHGLNFPFQQMAVYLKNSNLTIQQ